MPNKEFLETFSLYRKFSTKLASTLDNVASPPINGLCANCDSMQTFRQNNNWYELAGYSNYPTGGQVVRAQYVCTSCTKFLWTFYLRFGDNADSITKIGQWPAWSIKVDKRLAEMMGEHANTYKKGLVCESQSYGIGAFAYYRRIVEEIIDQLLAEIGELISETEREQYNHCLLYTSPSPRDQRGARMPSSA